MTKRTEAGSQSERAGELAAAWLADFRREALLEDGDPEAVVERVRGLAEDAGPGTVAAAALPLFLERLAAVDDAAL